ncbi:CHAT domain-containing protein [Zobellia amurskyensis]|uniref:CHAT domain-containing protein n=1 Tax=Zobellia amurskyensis TaxID=248905 RepID=A0A7X2ZVP9_9FLAO|nr:CHAT domain-containing protein [Zobellia amurskyensis]MUH37285.1 CHAT domain-containing protein [Zobellia amurskyensis]
MRRGLSYMKYFHYIVCFLFVFFSGWSQETPSNLDDAFNKALEYHYVNKDSAYVYYEKTIAIANEQDNMDYLLGSLSYLINANSNFYDLQEYRRNLQRMEDCLLKDSRTNGLEISGVYKNRLLFDKGNFHYKLKEYSTARTYFLELYSILKAVPEEQRTALDIDTLSAIYSFLGLIYRHTGKYEQAEFYYTQDLNLIETFRDSIEDWQSASFNTKKLLSQVFEVQGNTIKASELLKETLEFYKAKVGNPRFKNNFLSTYILLAKNYLKQGEYDNAVMVLNENHRIDDRENPFSKEICVLYADAFLGKKNYQQAENYYERALNDFKAYRQHRPHQDIAHVYGKMAKLYLEQHNFEEGLNIVQKAFRNSVSFKSDTGGNPKPRDVFSKIQLLNLLDVKLQLLQSAYAKTNNLTYEQEAITTSKDILTTFDELKLEFDSKLDKQFLAEEVYPIFHRMLDVVYENYERTGSKNILELALNIAEKNKDFILLEALRGTQATRYGNVPQNILDKEVRLRAEITHFEKEIFDGSDDNSKLEAQIFNVKQAYYALLDTLKQEYPKYHDLKYGSKTLNFATIRNTLLKDGGTIVSFTLTNHHLYAIILNSEEQGFLKLPFLEADKKDITDFYRILSKPSLNGGVEEISVLGNRLFEKILKHPLKDIDSENLTIIPDGELHYIPFDLLRENDSYLLETKSIGYGNSITSLLELIKKGKSDKNHVLAFAPNFDEKIAVQDNRQFGKLLYNDDEVSGISSYFNTQKVLDQDATLVNFKANSSNFNIIHLATHASANDAYPDYSYLAFSQQKDSSENNVLYIKDLYNISLNADLVTLSACQTGIGKLQKGQGMLSLSKGFYYAGAKSLVNTLWKINDKSSVKLMEFFYEGLSKGKSKAKALRDAKLKYLETTDDNLLQHPYYWSAFVVSGDISPITKTSYWWYWGSSFLVLSVFYGVFWYKKKRSLA